MSSQRKGYIPYTLNDKTRNYIKEKILAANCHDIVIQPCLHDKKTLAICLDSLKKGDVLITWRLDRLTPHNENKACCLSGILKRGITIIGLADNIVLKQGEEHAGGRICHYFNRINTSDSSLLRRKRKRRLNNGQIRSIIHVIKDKKSTISDLARQYGVSRTTVYVTLKRYAEENDFE